MNKKMLKAPQNSAIKFIFCSIKKSKWKKAFIILFSFTFFVFGVPTIINELYKVGTGYYTLWNASDALSFYAVILSGLITIFALIVTIYYSKKDTEKQIRFSQSQTNAPFFIINNVYSPINEDFNESKDGKIWHKEYIVNKLGCNQGEIFLSLTNIGEGIAIAPKYTIDFLQDNDIIASKFVAKGNNLELIYNLQEILEARFGENSFPNYSRSFTTCITLTYQNTLGIEFSQKITFQHDWYCDRNTIVLLVHGISPQNVNF